jgi:hypothetical protein
MRFAKPTESIQMSLFSEPETPTEVADFIAPKTYTGLAGFHKYWGKKPIESIAYLIENCTRKGDIVMDPFLGSGLISREALLRERRFIGIDINPFSVEHTSFILHLPSAQEYFQALTTLEKSVADSINNTYLTAEGRIASHYLWEKERIISVWTKAEGMRCRSEREPSEIDFECLSLFKDYRPRNFRDLKFFTNSRINVNPRMSIVDIFTGRAMRNIDLLLEAISGFPSNLKRALLLTLTSAAGQMSNMVFAIKNRSNSKNKGDANKIEVGSWVIGFWLPETHFEVNAWNCFKNRAIKLLKALPHRKEKAFAVARDFPIESTSHYDAWIINADCRSVLRKMPSETVAFVCTDPPHSDRIPYLELSELWNSLLGFSSDFSSEIVVSNAQERGKSKSNYNSEMTDFFIETCRILKPNGYIALYFNARDSESWRYLTYIEKASGVLKFKGCFPMAYSATSVVQDNRKGSMKSDYVIIYQKLDSNGDMHKPDFLSKIPGWSSQFPKINGE